MSGYIYAMQAGDFIKFGWAKDVESRRLSLQTGCPWKIEVIGAAEWPRKFERAIHEKLKHVRSHGEWFKDCEDSQAVVDMLNYDYRRPLRDCVGIKRDGTKNPRINYLEGVRAGLDELMKQKPLSKSERKVFWFMMEEAKYGNVAKFPHVAISRMVGVSPTTVTKSIRSLIGRQLIIRVTDRYMPNIPTYIIDPELFFSGPEEDRLISLKEFAELKNLTVVK